MRRIILLAAAALLAAGCSSNTTNDASSTPTRSPSPTKVSPSPEESSPTTAAPSRTASPKASPKPSPTKKSCEPTRDVLVWMKQPDVPDSAQLLGNYGPNCQSTFDWLPSSSPTTAGFCTQAAYASDNPGYNADAEPARRLKKVRVSVGPAC